MTTSDIPSMDRLSIQVQATAQKLAQLRARQMLQDMREQARGKAASRRLATKQRLELGDTVRKAGCESLDVVELLGLLMDGAERLHASPTMRLAFRRKGEEKLAGRSAKPLATLGSGCNDRI